VRTIFAMGGGGFTMEPANPLLDEVILGLARRPVPRICFLPTASGEPLDHVARFYEAFSDRPCECSDLSLFRLGRRPVDLRAALLAQDIVYVGGGSMRNMLAIWRVHELDAILRECWARGVVLAGLSAGAMCWFEAGVSKSRGAAEPVAGLGLLRGSLSVHYDGEPERRPVYLDAVASGAVPEGFGADDGVGLLFRDERLVRVVASRPHARCVRVRRTAGGAVEQPVAVEVLPADDRPLAVAADVREFRAMRRRSREGGAGCRRSASR
jgi:dipeptidase E